MAKSKRKSIVERLRNKFKFLFGSNPILDEPEEDNEHDFGDILYESMIEYAYRLESERLSNSSNLRNLYGEDIGRRTRKELEEE
jgi:hypothetical protein